MTLIKSILSPIQGYETLKLQLEEIEAKLNVDYLSYAEGKKIIFELECTRQSLQELTDLALSQNHLKSLDGALDSEFSQIRHSIYLKNLDELKDKVITLFGDIYNLSIACEINAIHSETALLAESLRQENLIQICTNIQSLSLHIQEFCRYHRPSRENKTVIASARKGLESAEAFLYAKIFDSNLNPFKIIQIHEHYDKKCYDPEELEIEMMNLFEIAHLFYQCKFKNAHLIFDRIPKQLKNRIFHHINQLTTSRTPDLQQDVYATIQALIATAHELFESDDGESYMSKEEIDEMFKELDHIKSCDIGCCA